MNMLIIMNVMDVRLGNGIMQTILNFQSQIACSDIRFHFAMNIERDASLIDCLTRNGGTFHPLPNKKRNLLQYSRKLRRVCRTERFDAVHIHGNSATMALELWIAKQAGIPVRISHCHSDHCSYPWLNFLLLPLFHKLYTDAIACSRQAGDWLFPNGRYTVLHNAIDLNRFAFSEAARTECRKQLELRDGVALIGHAGNFSPSKNHAFLIEVMQELMRSFPCELLLLGDGPFYENILAQVKRLHMENSVHFLGVRQDVEKWMCAMDLFLFPSLWEGLGMAAIEAQANGLPVLASTAVPSEVKLTPSMEFLSLSESAATWASKIRAMLSAPSERTVRREDFAQYDIRKEKDSLLKIYRHE